MRKLTIFALVAGLLLPQMAMAQIEEDSTRNNQAEDGGKWSIGARMYSSRYVFRPEVVVRRKICAPDDVGATLEFYGDVLKQKSWERVDEGVYRETSSPTYSNSLLHMTLDWRHFQKDSGSIRSYRKLGLSLELTGFIDNDNSIDYQPGPLIAFGYQWKPNDQISLFVELGGYARYSYDKNSNYDEDEEGNRYLQSRYVYRHFYYGFESAFGFTFTLN